MLAAASEPSATALARPPWRASPSERRRKCRDLHHLAPPLDLLEVSLECSPILPDDPGPDVRQHRTRSCQWSQSTSRIVAVTRTALKTSSPPHSVAASAAVWFASCSAPRHSAEFSDWLPDSRDRHRIPRVHFSGASTLCPAARPPGSAKILRPIRGGTTSAGGSDRAHCA